MVMDAKDMIAFETIIKWSQIGVDPAQRILDNGKRVQKRIEGWTGPLKDEPVAVCGYGPSLNDTWREVNHYKTIFTCSGAHRHLLGHGVTPTFHVETDPQEHKVKMLGKPVAGVQYLMASTTHPNYLDALEGYDVTLFHIFLRGVDLPRGEWCITCPGTVAHFTARIARFLGYTNLHFFGVDHSLGDSGRHAGVHTGRPEGDVIDYLGYKTTEGWVNHMWTFFTNLDTMPDVKYTFHGNGLIQHTDRVRRRKVFDRFSPRAVQF